MSSEFYTAETVIQTRYSFWVLGFFKIMRLLNLFCCNLFGFFIARFHVLKLDFNVENAKEPYDDNTV